MREVTMYCSARDQDVRIIVTDEPLHEGQAPVLDPEIICLELGERCTGRLCPVCAIAADAMDARLAKSGLRPDTYRKVHGACDACDRDTDLVVSSGGYLSCTECGATRKWKIGGIA
jgi:hypothetical protein